MLIQDLRDKLQETVVEWKEELGRKALELHIRKSKVIDIARKGKWFLRITCDVNS